MPPYKLRRHSGVVADTTPDAFTLDDITDATLSTTQVFNTITVSGLGLGISVTASASGDASSQIQKNGAGSWLTSFSVTNGDTVTPRNVSSSSNSTGVSITVTIGGVSATATATTIAAGGVVYDTAVGNGVDSAGFADLPLRSGAHRYFVNNLIGSDTHTSTQAQDPTTPIATLAKAKSFVVAGNGDQIMVAEGTTYSETLFKLFQDRSGFSAVYPTVMQSYDPADALNEAKYGRATGTNRPKFTSTGVMQLINGSSTSTSVSNLAIRGFEWDAGNISGRRIQFNDLSGTPANNILFENNVCRYSSVERNATVGSGAVHFIVRNCAIYGSWQPTAGVYIQGVYSSSMSGVTVEDCVLYHNGWKVGALRSDPVSSGGFGGSINGTRNHPVYLQNDGFNYIYRRNLVIDGPADGGHTLADSLVSENVVIDCPIGLSVGGGVSFAANKPDGVDLQTNYNVLLGSADQSTDTPHTGSGIWFQGGSQGSRAHHNIVAHGPVPIANSTDAAFRVWTASGEPTDFPSYMDWDNNVEYQFGASGEAARNFATTGPVIVSYTDNILDGIESDSVGDVTITSETGNVSSVGYAFPNPYTFDELAIALGYSGADAAARKQAVIDYAINNPEAHPGRAFANLAWPGYGIDHSVGV